MLPKAVLLLNVKARSGNIILRVKKKRFFINSLSSVFELTLKADKETR